MYKMDICCVTLVGLPGSGKTTFCDRLVQISKERVGHVADIVIHVCYDDVIPVILLKDLSWHEARKQIIARVEKLILLLFSLPRSKVTETDFFPTACILFKTRFCSTTEKLQRVMILLDDNMYYRSMRYEYYQLCKTYGISFGEIYLECDIQKALANNYKRCSESVVPEETVTKMASKLEPPEPLQYFWEKYSFVVPAHQLFSDELKTSLICFIDECFKNPLQKLEYIPEENKASHMSLLNLVHQLDVISRKIVSEKIKDKKKKAAKEEFSLFCNSVNAKRKEFLNKIKLKSTQVPGICGDNITDSKVLHVWISDYLDGNL